MIMRSVRPILPQPRSGQPFEDEPTERSFNEDTTQRSVQWDPPDKR
jgi:hypothetical protein